MGRDGKTEKATPQRRREARREGQVARSQEVGVAVSLAGLALALRVFTPAGLDVLRRETALLLGHASGDEVPFALVGAGATRIALALGAPLVAVAVLCGIVGGVGQVGFAVSGKAARPKLSNLSPKQGLQRLKPSMAGYDLLRTAAKLGLLVAATWGPLEEYRRVVGVDRGLEAGLARTLGHTWTLLLRGLLVAALIAAADYLWNRRKLARDLRMSKDDIRQEHKNAEGDPLVKGQRRRRAQELSRNRMLRDVATADIVVTNPTHLAVALRYSDGEAAPRVVAKGADRLAAKIRGLAYRNGVPVREDKPLARALYRRCKVGAYVPAALYEAVAVVLAVAFRQRGRVGA